MTTSELPTRQRTARRRAACPRVFSELPTRQRTQPGTRLCCRGFSELPKRQRTLLRIWLGSRVVF